VHWPYRSKVLLLDFACRTKDGHQVTPEVVSETKADIIKSTPEMGSETYAMARIPGDVLHREIFTSRC